MNHRPTQPCDLVGDIHGGLGAHERLLERLRRGEALDAREKKVHDDGLVTLLRQIHDEIDAAVLSAHGRDDLRRADTPSRDLGRPFRPRGGQIE